MAIKFTFADKSEAGRKDVEEMIRAISIMKLMENLGRFVNFTVC